MAAAPWALLAQPPPLWWWWWLAPAAFVIAVATFHLSEGLLVFTINPDQFSPARSFLISKPYVLAMSAGLAEYLAGLFLFPGPKSDSALASCAFALGLALVAVGEGVRKSGVLAAGRAFTHDLQPATGPLRVPRVVQGGVYAWVRHPGYLGWLLWAPGTMVLLANPLSAAAFAALAWRFFAARIPREEALLLQMYGQEYAEYRRRVPTRMGIP